MKNKKAFTLIELLIVIIIIVIISFMVAALFQQMFRGHGVRESARMVAMVIQDAKEFAAKKRLHYYIIFFNDSDASRMRLYEDDGDGYFDPQTSPADVSLPYQGIFGGTEDTNSKDLAIDGGVAELPRNIRFCRAPRGIRINPTGQIKYPSAFIPTPEGVGAGAFDSAFASAENPNIPDDITTPAGKEVVGDIVVSIWDRYANTYRLEKMCIDIEVITGKVRRAEFLERNFICPEFN